jgi:hypothetical protein
MVATTGHTGGTPMWPTIDTLRLSGSCYQTSGNASQGATMAHITNRMVVRKKYRVFALLRIWRHQLQRETKTVQWPTAGLLPLLK